MDRAAVCRSTERSANLRADGADVDIRSVVGARGGPGGGDPTRAEPDQLTAAVDWAGMASRHRYRSAIVDVTALEGSTVAARSP